MLRKKLVNIFTKEIAFTAEIYALPIILLRPKQLGGVLEERKNKTQKNNLILKQ